MFTFVLLKNKIAKKCESEVICDFVKIISGRNFCVLTEKFVESSLDRIKNLKVYEDDVWLVSPPKCGTTWVQEMIFIFQHDFDYEKAAKTEYSEKFPFIE